MYLRLALSPLLILLLCTCGRAQLNEMDTLSGPPETSVPRCYTDALAATRTAYQELLKDDLFELRTLIEKHYGTNAGHGAVAELSTMARVAIATEWPYDPANYSAAFPFRTASVDSFSADETATVARTRPILELAYRHFLEPSPPFALHPLNSRLRTELSFYSIADGEAIAEIGTGSGYLGLLIAAAHPNSPVVLTELNSFDVAYFKKKIAQLPELYGDGRVTILLGEPNDALLPASTFDKIIIRNTFHHFGKTRAMLATIRPALKPGGTLIVAEPAKKGSGVNCKTIRSNLKTVNQITNGGFRLEEKLEKEGWFYMRFVLD